MCNFNQVLKTVLIVVGSPVVTSEAQQAVVLSAFVIYSALKAPALVALGITSISMGIQFFDGR